MRCASVGSSGGCRGGRARSRRRSITPPEGAPGALGELPPRSALVGQSCVQVEPETLVEPALDGMDLDPPRVDQRADCLTIPDVHADMLEVAPDDQVADLWVIARNESAQT